MFFSLIVSCWFLYGLLRLNGTHRNSVHNVGDLAFFRDARIRISCIYCTSTWYDTITFNSGKQAIFPKSSLMIFFCDVCIIITVYEILLL